VNLTGQFVMDLIWECEQEFYGEFKEYIGGRQNGWFPHLISFGKNVNETGRNCNSFSVDLESGTITINKSLETLEIDVWFQGYAPHGYITMRLYRNLQKSKPTSEDPFEVGTSDGHLYARVKTVPGDTFHIGNFPAHIQQKPVTFTLAVRSLRYQVPKASVEKETLETLQTLRERIVKMIENSHVDALHDLISSLDQELIVPLSQPSAAHQGQTLAELLSNLSITDHESFRSSSSYPEKTCFIRDTLCLFRSRHHIGNAEIHNNDNTNRPKSLKCICGSYYNENYCKEIELFASLNASEDSQHPSEEYGERLHQRGVTVDFLVNFTTRYGCSSWPTWRVVLYIIQPETLRYKCRYVELPMMKILNVVDRADIFISHCWQGSWGTLVSCATHQLSPQTHVWCDIFAVRQWKGSGCDLVFEQVIKRCCGLLVIVPLIKEVQTLNNELLLSANTTAVRLISAENRTKIPFFRSWCLAEIHAAVAHAIPLLFLSGTNDNTTVMKNLNSETHALFYKLHFLVSIQLAEAELDTDRERILTVVASTTGLESVNREIRGALLGAIWSACCPDVARAAIRQNQEWKEIFRKKSKTDPLFLINATIAAAASGYISILTELVQENPTLLNAKDDTNKTVLMYAAEAGFDETIRFLASNGSDVNAVDNLGMSVLSYGAEVLRREIVETLIQFGVNFQTETHPPLLYAARYRNLPMIEVLLAHGADINVKESQVGYTAIREAVYFGNYEIAKYLITQGARVDILDNWNGSILRWAIGGSHINDSESTLRVVELVVQSGGIMNNEKASENVEKTLQDVQDQILRQNIRKLIES
jgi:hypothetical protein